MSKVRNGFGTFDSRLFYSNHRNGLAYLSKRKDDQKGMNEHKVEGIVSANQTINDIRSLTGYLGTIRSISVEGRFDNTHGRRVMFVSCLHSGRGIVLAPTPARQTAVDADNGDLMDCIRLFWPASEKKMEFMRSGFRMRGLNFYFIEQPHSSVVNATTAQKGIPIPRRTPAEEITGIAQLAGYLQAHPYVVVSGDLRGMHFTIRVLRLEITPLDLLLDYGGEITRLPCPPIQAFRFRPGGFAIARLSFYYTSNPNQSSPKETCHGEKN